MTVTPGSFDKGILTRFRDREGESVVRPFQEQGEQPVLVAIPFTWKKISRIVNPTKMKEVVY